MFSLIPGLALVAFGMLCHRRGLRRAAFASDRAQYLPANVLVQAAALCWIVPVLPAGHSLLLVAGQLIGITWLASNHELPSLIAVVRRGASGSRERGRAMPLNQTWQTVRLRTGS